MNRRRLLLSLVWAASLLGCAVGQSPYAPPPEVVLQDSPPGQAIVYLIRTPYDHIAVEVKANRQRVASMPSSTYTAIVLPPGVHSITTHSKVAGVEATEVAPSFSLELKAGERVFLYLSGSTDQSPNGLSFVILGRSPVPIVPARRAVVGDRSWKYASELDAQGLMSVAKVVLPEQ